MIRNHADFMITRVDHNRKIVFMEDLDLGNKSVTNDAEFVVESVNAVYPKYRQMYLDSMKQWDELVHENGKFVTFLPLDTSEVFDE
jgi:hypothetical protein